MKSFKKNFDSLLQKYQENLKESMKDSECVSDSVDLLNFTCHKLSLNWCKSYINFPKWLKVKKLQ